VAAEEGEKLHWSVVPAVQRWKKTVSKSLKNGCAFSKVVVTFVEIFPCFTYK
jgi:hypothetical protein